MQTAKQATRPNLEGPNDEAQGRKFVSYCRLSTQKQGGIDGFGIDAQQHAVRGIVGPADELVAEFVEVASGGNRKRPELAAAIEACKRHGATLVVPRIDRLARDFAHTVELLTGDVDVIAADMPEATRMVVYMAAILAEHQREQVSKDTKAAMARAKARGVKLGGPNAAETVKEARAAFARATDAFAATHGPTLQLMREAGMSYRQMAAQLNAQKVPARRGGVWYPSTVQSALRRFSTES